MLCALSFQGLAQSGIATYKTAASVNFSGDSTLSHGQQAAMQMQLRQALQREYELKFNGSESSYKQIQSLDKKEVAQASDVMVRVAGGSSLTYKDTKKKRYLQNADLFGKPFLIDDELEALDWEITGEKKQIGKYECQQARYTREARMMQVDTENGQPKEVVTQVEVTAWFTMDIPVNHGPDDFWGLPGLILEVNNGNSTIICSKILLNPQEKVVIEKPKGGKSITTEKFNELQEEKLQEMMQQYNGNGEERRVIRIGG
ncbi:GLPGLI family protein [Reichenbachiella faecimaris]|uniref:GLPGLI family protein n=2 Tax=Reichenbachiella faecimaris TaxID=692418 RepID=A0A1W2G9I6_REIFA|nr:GLPGLI family protein [Reichenbachiella faecimaris]